MNPKRGCPHRDRGESGSRLGETRCGDRSIPVAGVEVGGACVCLEGREKKTAWCRVWEMEGLREVAGGAEI